MSRSDRYHAEIRFGYTDTVRFTAVDLDRLLERFTAEVHKRREANNAARRYVIEVPNLIVEYCSSWSSFESYEHA